METTSRGTRVTVAAGSNLGDRMARLRSGLASLMRWVRIDAASRVVETAPEGGVSQGDYLNLVATGLTELGPRELLDRLLEIEREEGRVRSKGGGEPRTLDLDLVLHGDAVLREPGLTLPHPRWHLRPFVAIPLLEVLPEGRDPLTGERLSERVSPAVLGATLRTAGRIELSALPRPNGWQGDGAP